VTRYIQPLREGGSLPALAEADDGFKYVLKFRGTGHGVQTLIAELLGGEIARAMGLKVPELVFANLDEAFGRTEGDEEIQDLLKNSQGLNLGLHFLSGAVTFDPLASMPSPGLASDIVWLDSFITNVDRTFRNTNILCWHRDLWLIDHGSAFYFQYNWDKWEEKSRAPFSFIKDHVLLREASELEESNSRFRALFNADKLRAIVELIPEDWLGWEGTRESADQRRDIYFQFIMNRFSYSDHFTREAIHARQTLV
jgi:hypothetical protein